MTTYEARDARIIATITRRLRMEGYTPETPAMHVYDAAFEIIEEGQLVGDDFERANEIADGVMVAVLNP